MEMQYYINGKQFTEEDFYKEVERQPEQDTIKKALAEVGHIYISDKSEPIKRRKKNLIEFCAAPKVVWDMYNIVLDNEVDLSDDDAFDIAWALYKSGFGAGEIQRSYNQRG